jgi:L-lactate dehydrogenase (cytochrome)
MSTHLVSIEEISKHNSPSDCWVVIDDQVWDMTEFAPSHPGGPGIIYRYAGRDATQAYSEIHAPSIIKDNLAASNLKGKIDPSTINNEWLKPPLTTQQTAPSGDNQKPDLDTIINAHDFELAAQKTSTAKTWAFYSSAADDLITRDANKSLYTRIWFRPRVMRNVRTITTHTTILGQRTTLPLFISPAAMAKLIHPDGELAIARACASKGIIQCISTSASYSASTIVSSTQPTYPKHPFFFQLYVDKNRSKSAALLHTLHTLPTITGIFITADAAAAGKREADERVRADETLRAPMSGSTPTNDARGGGYGRIMGSFIDPALNWEDIAWLRAQTPLPLVLKGVMSASDVALALDHGLDGVLLSNHGGRNLDTAPPALLTLLECHKRCPQVFGRIDILVDGGIRRGSDILKCVALGATAVGVGRPVLFAASYGEEGVAHLLDILRDEFEVAMRNCGVTSIQEVGPQLVNTGDLDHLVPGEEGHPYVRDWRRAKL